MARTQSADYDQRREAILDCAADLFAEKGFNGASVADLAKACNTSKSLIYHYYPSKEDILHEVMSSHIDALVAAINELDLPVDASNRLHLMVRKFIDIYVESSSRQKVLLNELHNLPAKPRKEIVAKQRSVVAAVSQLIASIQPNLAQDKHRLTATTMLFFGMINWTKNWFHTNGPITPEQLADLASDIMIGGINNIPPEPGVSTKSPAKKSKLAGRV